MPREARSRSCTRMDNKPLRHGSDAGPADHVRRCSEFRASRSNPYRGNAASDCRRAKALYEKWCQACHLPDATGRIGPNLVDNDYRYPRANTDVGEFEVIYAGATGAMQAFGDRVTPGRNSQNHGLHRIAEEALSGRWRRAPACSWAACTASRRGRDAVSPGRALLSDRPSPNASVLLEQAARAAIWRSHATGKGQAGPRPTRGVEPASVRSRACAARKPCPSWAGSEGLTSRRPRSATPPRCSRPFVIHSNSQQDCTQEVCHGRRPALIYKPS